MATSRDLVKERYWRVIQRFEASGLGARRFCEREGLSEQRLYWWRRTLRQRDQGQARRPRSSGTGKPVRGRVGRPVGGRGSQVEDSAFLSVGLPFSVGNPIEVVHPRGHVVRVPAIFDPSVLVYSDKRQDFSHRAAGAKSLLDEAASRREGGAVWEGGAGWEGVER